ncbi:phosphoenolpyruvate--protein phosphotransferase [soil metagenome]
MTEINQSIAEAVRKPERVIKALAVSRGIAIGPVVFLHSEKRKFFRIDLNASHVENELIRFRTAVQHSKDELNCLLTTESDATQSISSIFGVHLVIIEGSSLVEKVENAIVSERINAEWALKIVSDQYLEKQASIADPHFREKYLDIEDVVNRILTALNGSPSSAPIGYTGSVVVAREIRPSVIMELTKSSPIALISERGGWTSHSSILAREFKLPTVSGIKDLDQTFSHGDIVVVDGVHGQVIVDPSPATLERYHSLINADRSKSGSGAPKSNLPVTSDGVHITIRTNTDMPEGYRLATAVGAIGIGLFRSESLLIKTGILPSEEEQFLAYRQIAEAAGEAGVKIRTFDIGVDQLKSDRSLPERNPSLGLRSIRLSLLEESHFRSQIRAILRASANHNVDIVLPMISGVDEVVRSRTIIDEEAQRLDTLGIPTGKPKLGAMIEVPSAVLTARDIAAKTDFICLGTNDLVQYLLAVDRDNDAVAEFYKSLHPAVIRAIGEVIDAGENAGIPVVICGEMAGSPFYVPLLIGLGARQFSMNVNSISEVSRLISGITVKACDEVVKSIKSCPFAEEIEAQLRSFYLANWSDLFQPGLLDAKHR